MGSNLLYWFISASVITYLILWSIARFSRPTKGLPHAAIREMVKDLGIGNEDGMCFGFSLKWAVENAFAREDLFYHRLDLVKQHQNKLTTTLRSVRDNVLKNRALTQDEYFIQDLPTWFKDMHRGQSPEQYFFEYGQLAWQSDIKLILKRISTQSEAPLHVLFETHTFSKNGAILYFKGLKQKLSPTISILLSSMGHTVAVKRRDSKWYLINIDGLYKEDTTPYQVLNSRQLVAELYSAIKYLEKMKNLTFNIDVVALSGDYSLAQARQFPPKKLNRREKIYFFAMAAMQGDIQVVTWCLGQRWPIVSHFDTAARSSPMDCAISNGRVEVIRLMLSEQARLINYKEKSKQATFLHHACQSGGATVVAELLDHPGIDVDPQDSSGRTPLMLACTPTVFTNDRELFAILFAKGASLDIKDNQGLTARDHAIRNSHQIAEEMINKELAKSVNCPQPHAPRPFFNKPAQKTNNMPSRNEDEFIFYTLG